MDSILKSFILFLMFLFDSRSTCGVGSHNNKGDARNLKFLCTISDVIVFVKRERVICGLLSSFPYQYVITFLLLFIIDSFFKLSR